MRAMPSRSSCAATPSSVLVTWTTRLAAMSVTLATGRQPVRAPPLACRGADPAAAERGQDARPTRQAAGPRRPSPPRRSATPDARCWTRSSSCAARIPSGPAPPWASPPGWPTWSPATPTCRPRRPRGPTTSTAASSTTPSTSPACPPTPGAGRRAASRSSPRCSGWSAPATASRRTGSPATPPCPASARWRRVWRAHLGAAVREAARPRAARRPQVHDVRRVLAARARPRAPGGHRAGAARVRRPAHGGQPLQQGHQGPAGPRPAGGRRQPRVGARPWSPPSSGSAGRSRPAHRGRSGTPIDVVVSRGLTGADVAGWPDR